MTKAALHVQLGHAHAREACKSCSFWCCNFNQVHTWQARLKNPGTHLCVGGRRPRAGPPQRANISDTPAEHPLRAGVERNESVLRAADVIRFGLPLRDRMRQRRRRAWDGGRTQGGRADGGGFFSFFKWHCRDRKERSTVLSVEAWGQLWPVYVRDGGSSDSPRICESVSGIFHKTKPTLSHWPPHPTLVRVSRKKLALGEIADGRSWTLAHCHGFWGACARYQHD